MQHLEANGYIVEIGSLLESSLAERLEPFREGKIFIFVDENTHDLCLEFLLTSFEALADAEVVILPQGEENKQLSVIGNVWEVLTEYEATRHDLMINLGGGIISDMGGFIAACYKRGIPYINIPTSLLAMVDASIGGKTGVNLGHFKNQIGVFNNPIALYVDPAFLGTLPVEQLLAGYAEMFKHGLIDSKELFLEIANQLDDAANLSSELLEKCIDVKRKIVMEDPLESGVRKILNFGHTFGHVIEGQLMDREPITHGHAVGIGMIMESYVSLQRGLLAQEEYDLITVILEGLYPFPTFGDDDIQEMIEMLVNDKKNKGGKILTCLLEGIGKCTFDHEITKEEALKVFLHFKNQQIIPN